MRKTAYSNLYAQVRDIKKLMEYSGHSQISTVMTSYVFVSEEYPEEIRKSIDAARPKLCGSTISEGTIHEFN